MIEPAERRANIPQWIKRKGLNMGDGNQNVVERAAAEKTASKGIERRDFLNGATIGVVGMGALPTLFG